MQSYNPFIAAAKAAHAQLSSERAVNYYQTTAWRYAQRSIDDTIVLATYAIWGVYTLGAMLGKLHYDAVSEHVSFEPETPDIEGTEVIALLPPSVPTSVPTSDNAIVTQHGITYAPVLEAEVIEPRDLPAPPVAALPRGKSEKEVRSEMMKFTRQDLRNACDDRGIAYEATDYKRTLCTKLIEYKKAQGGRVLARI